MYQTSKLSKRDEEICIILNTELKNPPTLTLKLQSFNLNNDIVTCLFRSYHFTTLDEQLPTCTFTGVANGLTAGLDTADALGGTLGVAGATVAGTFCSGLPRRTPFS